MVSAGSLIAGGASLLGGLFGGADRNDFRRERKKDRQRFETILKIYEDAMSRAYDTFSINQPEMIEQAYQRSLAHLGGMHQQARRDVLNRGQQADSAAMQDTLGRGLYNTTILDNQLASSQRQTANDLGAVNSQFGQAYMGAELNRLGGLMGASTNFANMALGIDQMSANAWFDRMHALSPYGAGGAYGMQPQGGFGSFISDFGGLLGDSIDFLNQ